VGTLAAVRAGPWKLFVEHEVAPQGKPDNKRPVAAALYNLAEDLSESRNVAAEHPEVVQSLSRLAEEARQDLGDGARLGRHSRPPGEVKTPRTLAPVDRPVPTLRVMSYNIHHGEGADGRVDLARIAELVRSEKPDLVALQEVDKGVARTQRRDLPAELAALTGMTCLFTNNFHYQGGEYGNAVLARHPVRNWTNRRLKMLRAGEQRGVMQVVVQVAGRELMFMNTHIDYRRDDAERLQNVEEFKEIIQGCRMPVVFCGDFNDPPGSRTYQAMSTDFDDAWVFAGVGNGYTITSRQPQKRIDYIWLRKGASLIPVRVWVPRTEASDHLPVVAELQLR
jgi:endonuclease/exonuclease/phosphatase family metal-dependent hydrolase